MALRDDDRYKLFVTSLTGEMAQILLRSDLYWTDVFEDGMPKEFDIKKLYDLAEKAGYALEVRFLMKQTPVPMSQSQSGDAG